MLTNNPGSPLAGSPLADPFFERRSHRHAVQQHLATGTLPLKFAYAGSAAWTHDRLARSAGYQSVIGAVRLEADVIETLDLVAPLARRIAEIGPGNGRHTAALLNALSGRGIHCEQYAAFDFSRTLLALAGDRIRRCTDPRMEFRSAFWDIEAGPSPVLRHTWGDRSPTLICLLGNTIGNLENPLAAVRAVHDSAMPGDVLLLGATLRGDRAEQEILAPYRTEVFRRAALEPLRCAGIDPDDVEFRLGCHDGHVTGHAVLRKATRINGQLVRAQHIVRCFASRRFQPDQVLDLLDRARWRVLHSFVDQDAEHMLVAAAVKGKQR